MKMMRRVWGQRLVSLRLALNAAANASWAAALAVMTELSASRTHADVPQRCHLNGFDRCAFPSHAGVLKAKNTAAGKRGW